MDVTNRCCNSMPFSSVLTILVLTLLQKSEAKTCSDALKSTCEDPSKFPSLVEVVKSDLECTPGDRKEVKVEVKDNDTIVVKLSHPKETRFLYLTPYGNDTQSGTGTQQHLLEADANGIFTKAGEVEDDCLPSVTAFDPTFVLVRRRGHNVTVTLWSDDDLCFMTFEEQNLKNLVLGWYGSTDWSSCTMATSGNFLTVLLSIVVTSIVFTFCAAVIIKFCTKIFRSPSPKGERPTVKVVDNSDLYVSPHPVPTSQHSSYHTYRTCSHTDEHMYDNLSGLTTEKEKTREIIIINNSDLYQPYKPECDQRSLDQKSK